ncbi:unnamed protein product [Brassica oleracea var. botrytis]
MSLSLKYRNKRRFWFLMNSISWSDLCRSSVVSDRLDGDVIRNRRR